MKHTKYSAVVVGSGIAGLYAAIKLHKESNLPNGILVITKTQLIESNSIYSQASMAPVVTKKKEIIPYGDGSKYDGEVANYIRFDFLNSPAQKLQSGDYIEIEYIGFFKSEADFAKFEGIKTKYDYSLIDPESGYSISSGIAHGAYLDVVRVLDADGNIVKQLTPGVCANSADNRFLVPVRKEASSLDMNGWAVVDEGIAGYKWSADGGKTWHDVQLVGASAFNNVGQAHLEAVALYLKNDKSQYVNIFTDLETSKVGGGFQHASIRIELSAYAGRTVDVVFAAVSAEDQTKLCPIAIFTDVRVK